MPPHTPLGQYLRARRELVRPEDVGLSPGGRRRVPGLRREELAMLAGISPNYYLRLEQGRDRNPSAQVIDALARALQLDADATAFMHSLARPAPKRLRAAHRERAGTSIRQLIAAWPTTPALVHDRHTNVLAANALAVALCPAFSPGSNMLRAVFVDPAMRDFYDDWDTVAEHVVAHVRGLVGREVDDPDLCELVRELSERSEDFRGLWASHEILLMSSPSQVYNHPVVGPLELQPERLAIMGTNGHVLLVRHAEPGSPSERALHRLAAIAAEAVPLRGRDIRVLAKSA